MFIVRQSSTLNRRNISRQSIRTIDRLNSDNNNVTTRHAHTYGSSQVFHLASSFSYHYGINQINVSLVRLLTLRQRNINKRFYGVLKRISVNHTQLTLFNILRNRPRSLTRHIKTSSLLQTLNSELGRHNRIGMLITNRLRPIDTSLTHSNRRQHAIRVDVHRANSGINDAKTGNKRTSTNPTNRATVSVHRGNHALLITRQSRTCLTIPGHGCRVRHLFTQGTGRRVGTLDFRAIRRRLHDHFRFLRFLSLPGQGE